MCHQETSVGIINPVHEVGRICRDHGVLFAIDAAQTAGLVEIDVAAMNELIRANAGHGGDSGLSQRIEQAVDTNAFLLHFLGVKYRQQAE